jgi:putative transposase
VKYSKSELIRLYKKETNLNVKERLFLIIKVQYDNVIPAYAADELHIEVDHGHYTGWIDSIKKD